MISYVVKHKLNAFGFFLQDLEYDLNNMRPKIQAIQDSAVWLVEQNEKVTDEPDVASENIKNRASEIVEPFIVLAEKLNDKQDELNSVLVRKVGFEDSSTDFLEQVTELETRASMLKPLSVEYGLLWKQVDSFTSLEKDVSQLAPLYKQIIEEGNKRLPHAKRDEKKDIEDKIKEMSERKDNLEKVIEVRREETDKLEPVAKDFDEVAEVFEPKLAAAEEVFSKLKDVPSDKIRCEQQRKIILVCISFFTYP